MAYGNWRKQTRFNARRGRCHHAIRAELDGVGETHERRVAHQIADIAVRMCGRVIEVFPIADALKTAAKKAGARCFVLMGVPYETLAGARSFGHIVSFC